MYMYVCVCVHIIIYDLYYVQVHIYVSQIANYYRVLLNLIEQWIPKLMVVDSFWNIAAYIVL